MSTRRAIHKTPAAGPDLAGLASFVHKSDRREPLRFVGRDAEIENIRAVVADHARGAGQTQVIRAAPGAGKTALLRELQARFKASGEARPVYLEAMAFVWPEQVIAKMFKVLEDPAAERIGAVETETEEQHAEGGLKLGAQLKAGVSSSRSVQRENRPATFFEAFQHLQKDGPPVVLLVDEAQLWEPDRGGAGRTSSLLSEAHVNPDGLPLLIVAAGLGETRQVLAERGASKLDTGYGSGGGVLGALEDAEMAEVCEAFFDRYRIVGNRRQRAEWTQALIAETDGWPRHLTNALRGAARALLAGQGDLAQASLAEAEAGAQVYRREYYGRQIEPFAGMEALLAAVFTQVRHSAGCGGSAIHKAIAQAYEENPVLGKAMPEEDVFERLLHQGLIQDFGLSEYRCPIPSLSRYVAAFCADRGFPLDTAGPPAPLLDPAEEDFPASR